MTINKIIITLVLLVCSQLLYAKEVCVSVPECYEARVLKESFLRLAKNTQNNANYHYGAEGLLIILGKQDNKYSYQTLAELVDYYFGDLPLDTLEQAILSSSSNKEMIKALKLRLNKESDCKIGSTCNSAVKRESLIKGLIRALSKNS